VTPGSFKTAINKEVGALLKTPPKTREQLKSVKSEVQKRKDTKGGGLKGRAGSSYPIESLRARQQKAQVIEQDRQLLIMNVAANEALTAQQVTVFPEGQLNTQVDSDLRKMEEATQAQLYQPQATQAGQMADTYAMQWFSEQGGQSETVQVRIEPFVPVVVGGGDTGESIFGGQVFLLRHVQIEDRHFLQGFQLNEKKLIEEVEESAERFMRKGMKIELTQTEDEESAYTAILDFGFGDLVLNLKEIDPAWISNKINWLRNWYFSIIAIVLLAVTLGLAGL